MRKPTIEEIAESVDDPFDAVSDTYADHYNREYDDDPLEEYTAEDIRLGPNVGGDVRFHFFADTRYAEDSDDVSISVGPDDLELMFAYDESNGEQIEPPTGWREVALKWFQRRGVDNARERAFRASIDMPGDQPGPYNPYQDY